MTGHDLLGQAVVVIGGSAGIGLGRARRARVEGADVTLTGRNRDRLEGAASEVGARSTSTFEAHDPAALEEFFGHVEAPVDHVMVTAGRPYYSPLVEMDFGAPRILRAPDGDACLRALRWREGAPGRHPGVHGRHRRSSSGCRHGRRRRGDGGAPPP